MKTWLSIVTVIAGLLLPAGAWAEDSRHPSQEKPKHQHVVVEPRPLVQPKPVNFLKPGRDIDPGYSRGPSGIRPYPTQSRPRPYPEWQRQAHPVWTHTYWNKHYGTRVYQDNEGRRYYWCQPDSRYRLMDDAPYGRHDFGEPPAEEPEVADPGAGTHPCH